MDQDNLDMTPEEDSLEQHPELLQAAREGKLPELMAAQQSADRLSNPHPGEPEMEQVPIIKRTAFHKRFGFDTEKRMKFVKVVDLANDYDQTFCINEEGIIKDAGKFEGEHYFVPYLWHLSLNGLNGETAGYTDYQLFVMEPDDKFKFGELSGVYCVVLQESEQGFVYAQSFITEENYNEWVAEREAEGVEHELD